MDTFSTPNTPHSTLNSALVPTAFDPPRYRHGKQVILEPHRGQRRPKSCDHKLLAAYVAAYTPSLIPMKDYRMFISPKGEQEWKRVIRVACDKEWRAAENRRFDDIHLQNYYTMRHDVIQAWPFTKYFDGAWIVKWAMRTTWTNRTRSVRRRDKGTFNRFC
jgi:hypothetical protein